MKRFLSATLLLLAFYHVADRPVSAQELVYYIVPETRKEAKDALRGKIKSETPGGVTIAVGKNDQTIPALDIVQIGYTTTKYAPNEFRRPYGHVISALGSDPKSKAKERRDLFAKALDGFNEMLPMLGDNPSAARYVQYRIADVQHLMAVDDPSLRPKALKALEDYTSANPGGWEIVPALKTLARMCEEDNDLPKAMSALERLADLPDAPKDLKREGNVAVSQMLMRAKDYSAAEKRLVALLDTLPPGDPQRAATQVYLVQSQVAQKKTDGAEKQLKDAIAGTGEPLLRGIAYNVLGDYYREKGQTEEAFWAYLRVDAMYNLDANEHAKSLYYLAQLFKDKKFGDRTGDPVRSKNYRDRLMDKRFAESDYQKLAEKLP